jgi:hypothetical protein
MSSAIIFAPAGLRFIQPRSVTIFAEPVQWVNPTRLGVTLDKRLTWLPHFYQVGKRTAERVGLLCPIPKSRSYLSIRIGVLLYKKFICLVMEYACPAWQSAAHTHVQRLQVLLSKCFRPVTGNRWYLSNRRIYQKLSVPIWPTKSELCLRTLTKR